MLQTSRLYSILALLPPPRIALELGCGEWRDFGVYRAVWPAARLVGIDDDASALRKAHARGARVVCGSVTRPPLRGPFDLILARHPDLDARRADWLAAFAALGQYLVKGGMFLATAYSPGESEQIQQGLAGNPTLRGVPLSDEMLTATEPDGRDRYILLYQRIST